MKFSKVIDLEDFSSHELFPYLQELAEREMATFGIETPHIIPDSKNWETAMALYAFDKSNLLKEGKIFAGIGAGTEILTELLANKGSIVFPVDRYLEHTDWSDVAPSGYMIDASAYARQPMHTGNIIPVHSDARALDLPSNFFDGIYSSGSIEHFGGLDGVEAAAVEMGRILKPGGIASISTEFWLDGPEHLPWFDDNCILFTPELLERHITQPSGLIPIGTPDNRPSPKTFETRKILREFLVEEKNIRTCKDKIHAYPNLILFHEGFLFCSVHMLLKKPLNWEPLSSAVSKVDHFRKIAKVHNHKAIKELTHFLNAHSHQPPLSKTDTTLYKKKWISKILISINKFVRNRPRLKYFIIKNLNRFPKIKSFLRRKINT